MSNVSVGRVVRLAGSEYTAPKGVVVRCIGAPMPNILEIPESEQAHAINVWQGLPAQATVFWQETGKVEYLLSSEVELDDLHSSYRAEDYGFPLFAVDTDGYSDMGVRRPNGDEVVRLSWLQEDMQDPDGPDTTRARLHQLIDAYCDKVESDHPSQPAEIRE